MQMNEVVPLDCCVLLVLLVVFWLVVAVNSVFTAENELLVLGVGLTLFGAC